MSYRSLLVQTCTISRPNAAPAANGWGEATAAPTVVASGVPCRTEEVGAEVARAGGVVATADIVLYMLRDAPVTVRDRIEVGGQVVDVLAVNRVASHHILVRGRSVR